MHERLGLYLPVFSQLVEVEMKLQSISPVRGEHIDQLWHTYKTYIVQNVSLTFIDTVCWPAVGTAPVLTRYARLWLVQADRQVTCHSWGKSSESLSKQSVPESRVVCRLLWQHSPCLSWPLWPLRCTPL